MELATCESAEKSDSEIEKVERVGRVVVDDPGQGLDDGHLVFRHVFGRRCGNSSSGKHHQYSAQQGARHRARGNS
jgi:hypothetical protein